MFKKNLFILLLLLMILTSISAETTSPKNWDKVHKWADFCHTFQTGGYFAFDSMNVGILDMHYGILGRFFKVWDLYYLLDTSFEANIMLAFETENELPVPTVGFGINYYLRIHLFPIYRMTMFVEGGWGMVLYTRQYPKGGTVYNLARQVGGGIKYALNDETSLVVTVRWYHTSNNDILGRDRNPGIDTIGVSMGFDFSFLGRKKKI